MKTFLTRRGMQDSFHTGIFFLFSEQMAVATALAYAMAFKLEHKGHVHGCEWPWVDIMLFLQEIN